MHWKALILQELAKAALLQGVQATRQGTAARIEVMGEHSGEHPPAASDWPATLAVDVEVLAGLLGGGDDAVVWLTVPLSGPSTPES